MESSKIDEEKLVRFVGRYPELYDSLHKDYGKVKHKDLIWNQMAEELATTSDNCRYVWKNLRTCYLRAMRKKVYANRWGDIIGANKKWKLEDEMTYMLPIYERVYESKTESPNENQEENSVGSVDEDGTMDCVDSERLIIEIRNRPLLYDTAHKEHGKPSLREMGWEEIGMALKQPIERCKKVWNCIRCSYVRVVKRQLIEANMKPLKKQKKWIYEDDMEFLKPFILDKKGITYIPPEPSKPSKDQSIEENSTKEEVPSKLPKVDNPPDIEPQSIVSSNSTINESAVNITTEFFTNMGNIMKKLPLVAQANIRAQIFNFISTVEIDYYRNLESVGQSIAEHQVLVKDEDYVEVKNEPIDE